MTGRRLRVSPAIWAFYGTPLAENDTRSAAWRHDNAAPSRGLDTVAGGQNSQLGEDRLEDELHLEHGEVVAEASLAASTPRHPDLGWRLSDEEALREEVLRALIYGGVVLH
jgi:hypothetical protein